MNRHLANKRRPFRRTRRVVNNAFLLVQSASQHVVDDPALLVLQVSRLAPFAVRARGGAFMARLVQLSPRFMGVSALGAYVAGDLKRAEELIARPATKASQLRDEVAILLDRPDLVPTEARFSTRARSTWARGELTVALRILEESNSGNTLYAQRLRSERKLLQPDFRLRWPRRPIKGPNTPLGTDEPLRVLHFLTNSLPHTQSGYSLRSHNILTALRDHGIKSLALTRTGYPVMVGKVFASRCNVVDGVTYRRTLPTVLAATPEGRLLQEVEEALHIVSTFRPHVLHATTDSRNALVAQAVSEATGIPWVFEVRGLMEETWVASRRGADARHAAAASEKVRLVKAIESRLSREADAVITLSRTMADELESRGVPPTQISLVPNGVEASLLVEDLSPTDVRERLGGVVGPDALVIGAASSLVAYEGFDLLLRAVALILADRNTSPTVRRELRVVLAGDGAAAPALAELAKELGLEGRVIMPGRVPRKQARYWVQAMDIVVVPRRDLEVSRMVTPQKPIEAMALGRPVVVSDLPALRETVSDDSGDVHGVLFQPDDPESLAEVLLQLLADQDLRTQLGSAGRAVARERTWSVMMRRYERAYRTVASKAHEESNSDT